MSNWISVKDRLPIDEYKEFEKIHPDENFEVIVMIKDAIIPTVLFSDGFDFFEYFDCECVCYDVTHWQPLPEPPKGDENNAD